MPSAYGRRRRCSVARTVRLSPYSASATTAVSVTPAACVRWTNVTARRHFSWNRIVDGIRAAAQRAGSLVHASGRYNAAPMGHARWPVHSAAVTATWQLATLPSAPQYCRATPTDCDPDFGKLVSSRIRIPVRSGTTARSRCHTASASHGACVTKCWNAWYDVGSLIRSSIADIDLRALSPSRPSTYCRSDTCCARWPKQSLN
jgi:hypothetical protein